MDKCAVIKKKKNFCSPKKKEVHIELEQHKGE